MNDDIDKEKKNRSILKDVLFRLKISNNRSLGTVFGVFLGLIFGIILVCTGDENLPLVGKNVHLVYRICGIFLAAGTGGNLSSYIGGTIDILTGDKTVVDLYQIIKNHQKKNKDQKNNNNNINNINNNNNNNNNNPTIDNLSEYDEHGINYNQDLEIPN